MKHIFVFFTLWIASLLIFFQNCSKGFLLKEEAKVGAFSVTHDPNCINNSDFNFCIIQKNPVVALGKEISDPKDASIFEKLFVWGVKLNINSLSNSDISITPSGLDQANAITGNSWKYTDTKSPKLEVQQVHAFVWATSFLNFLEQKFQMSTLRNLNLTIDPNANITEGTQLDPFIGQILLGRGYAPHSDILEFDFAMNGEVLVELMAKFYLLKNSPDLLTPDATLHSQCITPLSNTCICNNQKGCSAALLSGLAIFQRSLFFQGAPGFGETIANNLNGAFYCGLDTNPFNLTNLLASSAFSACSVKFPTLTNGDIAALGYVLAGSLAVIFKTSSVEQQNKLMKSLGMTFSNLNGKDDFSTFATKLQDVDSDFGNQLKTELQKRGL